LNSLQQMIEKGRKEINPGKYVQTEKEILNNTHLIASNREILFTILDRLVVK